MTSVNDILYPICRSRAGDARPFRTEKPEDQPCFDCEEPPPYVMQASSRRRDRGNAL
jgi:hypothetical protein